MEMNNAQKTLFRLYMQTLTRAAALVDHSPSGTNGFSAGEEAQQWEMVRECLEERLTDLNSTRGDTWSLTLLGFKSPTWILGIQGSNR
jgi:hypothetical protein